MGSMRLGLKEIPDGFTRMAEFYAQRARGGVGLIVTGGIAPNREGSVHADAALMAAAQDVSNHRIVTDAVHGAGRFLWGGVEGVTPKVAPSPREICLLQRKAGKVGGGIDKTTGWIHRMELSRKGVQMFSCCEYKRIDDQGLHLLITGKPKLLAVDNVVICAGQESNRKLVDQIITLPVHIIGGADKASELDAKRAIDQGTRLAAEF